MYLNHCIFVWIKISITVPINNKYTYNRNLNLTRTQIIFKANRGAEPDLVLCPMCTSCLNMKAPVFSTWIFLTFWYNDVLFFSRTHSCVSDCWNTSCKNEKLQKEIVSGQNAFIMRTESAECMLMPNYQTVWSSLWNQLSQNWLKNVIWGILSYKHPLRFA